MDFVVKDHSVYRNRSMHHPSKHEWEEDASHQSDRSFEDTGYRFRSHKTEYPVTQNSKASRGARFSLDRGYNTNSTRVYPKVLMEHLNDYHLDTKSRMVRVQAQLRRIHKNQLPMIYLAPEEPSIDERFDLITFEPAFDWRKRDEACVCSTAVSPRRHHPLR